MAVCLTDWLLEEEKHMKIKRIGIIGAGTMGNGIAQICANAELDVIMVDISDTAVERGVQ